jgi:UDP-N-acetyl-2-amino-2-deoxyglucuronate dehydrogenase
MSASTAIWRSSKGAAESDRVHYISICSPNNLHDAHIRTALRVGADALCEKPLVLNPWNLDILQDLESEYEPPRLDRASAPGASLADRIARQAQGEAQRRIRRHRQAGQAANHARHKVRLTYLTSRGTWYRFSWKGDHSKSGGIATNIGIHFFDMLIWLFGSVQHSWLHLSEPEKMAGFLELENADVEWYLGIDRNDLPADVLAKGQTTYRSITVDGREIEFSGGFTDLHTRVYEATMAGNGFGISDARPSIELVQGLRTSAVQPERGEKHIMLQA